VVVLHHVLPEENMNRWYLVMVQATLFHPFAVVIAWGRRNNEFQHWRIIPADSLEQAGQMADKIIARKIQHGYQIQPAFDPSSPKQ